MNTTIGPTHKEVQQHCQKLRGKHYHIEPLDRESIDLLTVLANQRDLAEKQLAGLRERLQSAEKSIVLGMNTTEDDFQHFLDYSGLRLKTELTQEDLRKAYYHGADVDETASPPQPTPADSTTDKLARALREAHTLMGPVRPKCCQGCEYEWDEALRIITAALAEYDAKQQGTDDGIRTCPECSADLLYECPACSATNFPTTPSQPPDVRGDAKDATYPLDFVDAWNVANHRKANSNLARCFLAIATTSKGEGHD